MGRSVGGNLLQRKKKDVDPVRGASFDWYKETFKVETRILGSIQRHIVTANAQRNETRDTENLHASEMCKVDWCHRQSWYRMIGEPVTNPIKAVSPSLANVFEEGHEIHDKYQGWLWQMGVLEGAWHCRACGHVWWGTAPLGCVECFSPFIEYMEVPIADPVRRIIGHADGQFTDAKGTALLEFKSIGLGTVRMEVPGLYRTYTEKEMTLQQLWKSITRPFPSHVRQAHVYMMCTGIETMVFVYEFKANQMQKEFVIRYRPDSIADIVTKVDIVNNAIDNGKVVRRPEWAEEDHKSCKACPYYNRCWGIVSEQGAAPQADDRYRVREDGQRVRVLARSSSLHR